MIQITELKQTGKKYWRSLEDLATTPQFNTWLHREFPEGADEMDGNSRRKFLSLMAASLGLAGLTACRRPVQNVLPLAKSVEEQIPGNPLFYATAMQSGGSAVGLIVECHDGRPTKLEGNPKHPGSLGAVNGFAQASILSLYDPDRSTSILKQGSASTWAAFTKAASEITGDGEGLRILSGRVISPTLLGLKAQLMAKFPKAKWVEYEPVSNENVLAGTELAFGEPALPHYHFEKADVIVSLDCDFLGLDSDTTTAIRAYASRRRVTTGHEEAINRLYVVESAYSITGGVADHRVRMRASDIYTLATELAKPLKVLDGQSKAVKALWKDLESHKGKCLVVAGPRQPAIVHALVASINQQLGNVGETVTYSKAAKTGSSITELAKELNGGKVQTLLILGGNPAYDAPADAEFAKAMKVPATSIHLSYEVNETSAAATWHIPEAHFLEAWGDVRHVDGTASIQQPMIDPLFGGKTGAEIVALLVGEKKNKAYDLVKAQWKLADKQWREALHEGIAEAGKQEALKVNADWNRIEAAAEPAAPQGIEVVYYASSTAYDGRFLNNGWLQETPDPLTKLVWDNPALISPKTAKAMSVKDGDILSIERNGRKVEAPAMIQPGHADDSISLILGYGRTQVGRVGKGVGYNAYPLRTSDAMTIATGAAVKKTGGVYKLVTTQSHGQMEGRPLAREASFDEYKKEPKIVEEMAEVPEPYSIYGSWDYSKGNQWGMAIDLNACIGCNACMVACQAENNIPIVGKDQISRGREMHWIRLDRYFIGSEEDPEVIHQPIACAQCEAAPCESVCPVAATSHSPEGLNDMVYNRCVGTRYCLNNCPFKVRRFNFLAWNEDVDNFTKNVFNPNVTVRMRGVMEKCTYCVQRIQEVKIQAKADGRRQIRDGEIKTACQQTCPAQAITFGNINDPESEVSKLKKQHRNYTMLDELNIKPRTSFLARMRNPNPEVA
jgi:MoCo/4Fe-4S cofactor protein with predicted Tat translocation signal